MMPVKKNTLISYDLQSFFIVLAQLTNVTDRQTDRHRMSAVKTRCLTRSVQNVVLSTMYEIDGHNAP